MYIYARQTLDQQRFAISDVAADWHELMIPPSIAGRQHDAAIVNTVSLQSATLDLYPAANVG